MRAQFLWQILHTFDNILSNKKWDGIIICIVPVREREWGKEGTLIIARANRQQYYQMGYQNECGHAKVGMFPLQD
jgi:hypothetical protein